MVSNTMRKITLLYACLPGKQDTSFIGLWGSEGSSKERNQNKF